MTLSTTIGLNTYEMLSRVGYVHATASRSTLDLLICSSVRYRALSGPPPKSLHVVRPPSLATSPPSFGVAGRRGSWAESTAENIARATRTAFNRRINDLSFA